MEKEEVDHDDNEDNYYTSMDYSHLDRQQHHQFMKQQQQQQQQQQPHEMGSSSSVEAHNHASTYNINQGLMVDYMLNNNNSTTITATTLEPPSLVIQQSNTSIAAASAGFLNGTNTASTSFDRLSSFAEVMQFADFGPKLASNQQQMITTSSSKISSSDEETGMDPVYFLKFPVLSDRLLQEDNSNHHHQYLPPPLPVSNEIELQGDKFNGDQEEDEEVEEAHYHHQQQHGVDSHDDGNVNSSVVKYCNRVLGGGNNEVMTLTTKNTNNINRRKRPRSVKTSEEVESQRMTHIAVERNRRKQMNEHLRVLRSLMPGSYVQRGDQASIIGGAIEFVRELEQLLQCLESQKRRRLFGSSSTTTESNNVQNRALNDQSSASPAIMPVVLPHQLQAVPAPQLYPPPAFPNADQMNIKHSNTIDEFEVVPSGGLLLQGGVREDAAENKSCLADVEVKVLGDDAMIKILSRRRPGQLLKTIAALEDLQFNILHTNITTIEQTVLYSFNVKVAASETTRFSAEDIASSVQQIFSFIHASSSSSNNNNITNI